MHLPQRANYLFGGSLATIEYAAEMGLEHHLGMTCDPVCGLVQIPCIERNAHAAARALDANIYANLSDGTHRIVYDKTVEVMKLATTSPRSIAKPPKAVWQRNTTRNNKSIYIICIRSKATIMLAALLLSLFSLYAFQHIFN